MSTFQSDDIARHFYPRNELIMKKFSARAALAASWLIVSSAAMADVPSSELKVTGSLGAPGCVISDPISGSDPANVFDFGDISTVPVNWYLLKRWKINCESKTYLTFTATDNQAASVPDKYVDPRFFGFGMVNGTGKLGYYNVALLGATVDGLRSNVFATSSLASLEGKSTVLISTNQIMGWSSGNTPAAGRTFEVSFQVTPKLAGPEDTNGAIPAGAHLNGSLTLNFAYGL